jgi:hypothetical protein
MRYGLEKEFFVIDSEGNPQILVDDLKNLPHDDCGWLAEARGNPSYSIVDAVFNLHASIYKLHTSLNQINQRSKFSYQLIDTPIMKVNRISRIEASKHYAKGRIKYSNYLGFETHRNAVYEATAGLHISFTNPIVFFAVDKHHTQTTSAMINEEICNAMFDFISIFVALDKAFEQEIKGAKRRPGFYELKSDGRIEYRSLPADVDLDKVITVLTELRGSNVRRRRNTHA